MRLKSLAFMILMTVGLEAWALQITLDNPPGDYRVFSLRGSHLTNKTNARHFDSFSFQIPDRFVIHKNGKADLGASLRNWRFNTPIGDGHPRTKNGVGYYPFKDESGKNRYIALEHIFANRPNVVDYQTNDLVIDLSGDADLDRNIGQTLSASEARVQRRVNPTALARRVQPSSRITESGDLEIDLGSGDELGSSARPVLRPRSIEKRYAVRSTFREEYPPRRASFSESRANANSYTNSNWKKKSYKQKAEYLHVKYDQLLRAHGFRDTYSPSVLVCKSYKESTFNPQIRTSDPRSTASGISQITRSTAIDTFSRGRWFRSKVRGFTHIRNGREFHSRMAGSMLAQMEFGMAILEQKRRDNGLSKSRRNMHTILQRYYGNKSSSANKAYADSIMSCASCAAKSGYVKRCLDKVYN